MGIWVKGWATTRAQPGEAGLRQREQQGEHSTNGRSALEAQILGQCFPNFSTKCHFVDKRLTE